MARGDVLQIVVFSFLFGAACAAIGAKAAAVVDVCKSLSEVMFRYTKYVMYMAPIGVGAAMAHTIGSKGVGVLLGLGKLVLTLYGALLIFIFVVLGAVALIARIPLRPFIRAVREPFIIAFSTASSEAALSAGAGKHGTDGRAEAHRRVRAAHRLQLQPGRQHAVSFDGLDLRGAGGGRPHVVRASNC